MSEYIYCDKVGAGPPHPKKRWGLFSKELTEAQARARYELNAVKRDKWFGIVRLDDAGQPVSYLQMLPRANGVVLDKINPYNSIKVSYNWGGYYRPEDESTPYEGSEDSVFLSQITWYAYPDTDKHLGQNESLGLVMMQFRKDGYVKEEVVTSHGFGEPDEVQLREFKGVDVSVNWFKIPQFGDWDLFFNPENVLGQHPPN